MENLYLAYDDQTFEEAMAEVDHHADTWKDIPELFEFLMNLAFHNMKVGACDSFTIYDQSKNIVFKHSKKISNNSEVA